MKKISLNQDWYFSEGITDMMAMFSESGSKAIMVDLPHDAMIRRRRTPGTANQHQTGFYPGGKYTYIKKWEIPEAWRDKNVILEFEGIADVCRIYLNGILLLDHYNPYAGIFTDVSGIIKPGTCNELRVEAESVEESSRWYSGAGIYRKVWVYVGDEIYIPPRGVHAVTRAANSSYADVEIVLPVTSSRRYPEKCIAEFTLTDAEDKKVSSDWQAFTAFGSETVRLTQQLTVMKPILWSDERPYMYQLKLCVKSAETGQILDSICVPVGLRTIHLSAAAGLTINDRPVKLRGTCIHHDNGILGAASYAEAEFRKCSILKEAGFNAIRSAHHPISKEMLQACDQLGMFIMDELSDMWTRTKNPHDYANYFSRLWQDDVAEMVEKDFNHPSVIMYSTGNEIPEAGSAYGARLNRLIHNEIKRLDPFRYTVSGINGLMAGSGKMPELLSEAAVSLGLDPEVMFRQQEEQDTDSETGKAGADEVNGMAQIMVGPFADAISTSHTMEELIGEFASCTDVAGYNYLTGLHTEDIKRHPSRLVVGTETFPADIVHLWTVVNSSPQILGDFTWTGLDYIGEAGCGIFHYDGGMNFSAHWPDRLAGIGDIDLLGERKPISYLRESVYGLSRKPHIGVLRMNRIGCDAPKTPWMFKDNIHSWTWPGFDGQKASVDVYANADTVRLYLNGQPVGCEENDGSDVFTFEVQYAPGQLKAEALEHGEIVGTDELFTAGKAEKLSVSISGRQEAACYGMEEENLTYFRMYLTDQYGRWNRYEEKKIKLTLADNLVLLGFGSADPSSEGSYQDLECRTYDGMAMAVFKKMNPEKEAAVFLGWDDKSQKIIF